MKIGIQYMIVGLLFYIVANTGKGEIGSVVFDVCGSLFLCASGFKWDDKQ